MLILMRREEEEVVIARGTEYETIIKVISLSKDKVRLGIEAPKHMTVNRREVQNKIDNHEAGQVVS